MKRYGNAATSTQAAVFTPDAEMWFASNNEWDSGPTLREGPAKTPDPNRRVDIERVTLIAADSGVVDARYSSGTTSGHAAYVFVKKDGRWRIRSSRIVRDLLCRHRARSSGLRVTRRARRRR